MMAQLLAHLWGDYILQSDWMAENKTKYLWVACFHALCYSLPFLLLVRGHSPWCYPVIVFTHIFIDRFRLARYVVWAKNWMGAMTLPPIITANDTVLPNPKLVRNYRFEQCIATGYPPNRPAWLTVWLLIIADNTIHLTCNYLALRYL